MKKNILPIYIFVLAIAIVALPVIFCGKSVALAQSGAGSAISGLDATAGAANLKSDKDAIQLAGQIVQFVLSFLGIIFMILMLYGGFIRMNAQGSPEKIKQSTGIITSAIVGIIIIFASYIITIFVIGNVRDTVDSGVDGANIPVENNSPTNFCADIGGVCKNDGDDCPDGAFSQGQQGCGNDKKCCAYSN
jgi:hypothetical protein